MAHSTPAHTIAPSDLVLTKQQSMPQARKIRMLVFFYLVLFGLNLLRVFVIMPWEEHLSDVLAFLTEIVDKASIWIGLTYLFVVYVEKQPFLTAVQLKGHLLKGLVVGILGSLVIVFAFAMQVFMKHQPLQVTVTTFFGVLPVFDGLIEEIPFRGFLQRHFQTLMPLSAATLLNALLFVAIHIPIWHSTGMNMNDMLQNGIHVFFLAILFCLVVRFSKSLWSSVVMHTVNNLISFF
jgi:uncharacterized protein